MFRENLIQAMRDYFYLLDRNYPQKSSLKLVGDKYQLSGEERSILYRGISGNGSSLIRREKMIVRFCGNRIFIDTYNILFTLANYLNGRPVFVSTDGFLRDAGELRGRFSQKKLLERTLGLVYDFILGYRDQQYIFLIDQPVSNSGKLASGINEFLLENHVEGIAKTCESPDYSIITEAGEKDLVCTSDSIIIEKVLCRVFDLSFHILNSRFGKEFPSLQKYLELN